MSQGQQEKMTTEQRDPVAKQGIQSPQPVSEHLLHNDVAPSSKPDEDSRDPEAVRPIEAASGEEAPDHQIHMRGIAAEADDLELGSQSHDAPNSPDDGQGSKQVPELGNNQNVPSVAPSMTTGGKKQLVKHDYIGKKSSESPGLDPDAMLKALERFVDEETVTEKRVWPTEEPGDKTRLPGVKQEPELIEAALDEIESAEEMNAEDEIEIAQISMGSHVGALQAYHSRKPAPTTRRTSIPSSRKRKGVSTRVGVPTKKTKPSPAPKSAPKSAVTPALKRQSENVDAIGKYTFNQLAGKGATADDQKNWKKNFPTLKLTKARKADMKKLQAAADKVGAKDEDSKARIDADIRALVFMTNPFNKSCTLKSLRGDNIPDEDMDTGDYEWAINGMTSTLRHHQMIAAGTMCIIERTKKTSGGLLFDYMGYGKTVESLALIVGNPGNKSTTATGGITTLVVVPPAAMQQWYDEVKVHCPGLVASLWTDSANIRSLLSSHILIISYAQLRAAYKEAAGTQKRKSDEELAKLVLEDPLFQTDFHRIILDEIHEIKGYRNLTFDAAMALKAECKWGLTGTPTPNGIEELFPYLKFIGHPNVSTMREFKRTYVGGRGRNFIPVNERFEKLAELLNSVMIMRTPSHSFLGTTLLKLPNSHPLPPTMIKFSEEEDVIYQSIKNNIRDHTTKKAALKEKNASWAALNESIIRLRQCVTSPLLLENLANEGFWSAADVASMKRVVREAGCTTTPFIDQIERWNLRSNQNRVSATPGHPIPEKSVADAKAVLDLAVCHGHDCEKPITQLIEPQKSECGHVWCKACFDNQIQIETLIHRREPPTCNKCKGPLGKAKPYSSPEPGKAFAGPTEETSTTQKRLGADFNRVLPRSSNLMDLLNQDPNLKMPRSGKVAAVIRHVVTWQEEAPDDKIISM